MKQSYEAFWPGTPGGYVPVLADEAIAARRGKFDPKEVAARSRETALSNGHTGTINQLTTKTRTVADVSKAMVGKKAVR